MICPLATISTIQGEGVDPSHLLGGDGSSVEHASLEQHGVAVVPRCHQGLVIETFLVGVQGIHRAPVDPIDQRRAIRQLSQSNPRFP